MRNDRHTDHAREKCIAIVGIIDVINVYNLYKKFFVNAFIILSTFISIKVTRAKRSKIMTGSQAIVHCVRIGHCLDSLGHGASDGKQLPHDGAPPTEQTSNLLCVRLVYKRLQSFSE